jgi:phosphoglycolate phosphatase
MYLIAASLRWICCTHKPMQSLPPRLRAVRAMLFDFDGTFADTAPDMVRALNVILCRHARPMVELAAGRPYVSSGARGMLDIGFGLRPGDIGYTDLRDAFLDEYESNMCIDTAWFGGIDRVVDTLDARRVPWGIVTNKASRFALPLTATLGISPRAACIVCGDTTAHTKPHPAPLLHAARLVGVDPGECIYVGDDQRDVLAAQAAGMRAIAAGYGYIGPHNPPQRWGAEAIVDHPAALLDFLP